METWVWCLITVYGVGAFGQLIVFGCMWHDATEWNDCPYFAGLRSGQISRAVKCWRRIFFWPFYFVRWLLGKGNLNS